MGPWVRIPPLPPEPPARVAFFVVGFEGPGVNDAPVERQSRPRPSREARIESPMLRHKSMRILIQGAGRLRNRPANPGVQKLHLRIGMEPVLAILHDGNVGALFFCELGYGFPGGQVILSTIQNAGGNAPFDRMPAHIAQIFPGQGFPKRCRDFLFALQFILCNIRL